MKDPVNCTNSELCTFLQGLEEGFLPTYSQDTNQSAQSRSNPIASKSYQHGKKTVSFLGFQSLMMSKHSTASRGEDSSISSVEDFPVRIFLAPGRVRESLGHEVAYGERWHASFAKYDLDSCSWKTHQCSLFGGWESFLETWPKWGMMLAGVSSERVMSAHHTGATESGSWPTPTTMESLPPKSKTALLREATISRPGRSRPANLRDCVQPESIKMWPTPTANEDAAGTPDGKMQWMLTHAGKSGCTTRQEYLDGGTNTHKKLPTPRATDGKASVTATQNQGKVDQGKANLKGVEEEKKMVCGQLNPEWVEWLMGWPIGWTSLDPIAKMEIRGWQTDPADNGEIMRVATGVKRRVDRLKAIGNGQLPAVASIAWQILTDQTNKR